MLRPAPISQSSCCDSSIPYGKHVPFPAPISQSGCCDSFLIIFRIEVCPVLRLLFSESRSAQVLSDSDLVPDKTFKRYKPAQNHRIVPFKTFSRNDCGKISPAIPILRTPFHSADGLHRHRSLAVLYPYQCYAAGPLPQSGLHPRPMPVQYVQFHKYNQMRLINGDKVRT